MPTVDSCFVDAQIMMNRPGVIGRYREVGKAVTFLQHPVALWSWPERKLVLSPAITE